MTQQNKGSSGRTSGTRSSKQNPESLVKDFDPDSEDAWRELLSLPLDENKQRLLAKCAMMWSHLGFVDDPGRQKDCRRLLKLAMISLVCGNPMHFSEELIKEVSPIISHYRSRTKNIFIRNMRQLILSGDQPKHTRILLGLFCVLYFAIPLSALAWKYFQSSPTILGIPTTEFASAVVFGSLGSVISIMLRYDKLDVSHSHSTSLFFMGFFKPIIGAVFGLVVLSIFKSGYIPIKVPENASADPYFLLPMFFLAGFSERFAGDVLTTIESTSKVTSQSK